MHIAAIAPMARAMPTTMSGLGTSANTRSPNTAAATGSPQAARSDPVPASMRAMATEYRMYGRNDATAACSIRNPISPAPSPA